MRSRTAAPKPIKMIVPKLDVAGLRQAYEWMTVDRTASLRLALDWYSTNLTTLLYGDPLDADRQRSYERAVKSANIGEHTTFDAERQTSWATALRLYEKVWANKSLPSVAQATQAADMGSQPTRRVSDIRTVLNMLNSAYDKIVTFRMTFGSEREFDGEQILVPVVELATMVPLTPLKSALRELPTVAKVLSVALDENNEKVMDGHRFMETLPTLLDKVSDWASYGDLAKKSVGKAHTPTMAQTTKARNSGASRPVSAARNSPKIKFTDSDVIRVPKPIIHGRSGKAGKAFDLLRDGITFREYKKAVIVDNPKNGGWYVLDTLRYAVAHGMASIN